MKSYLLHYNGLGRIVTIEPSQTSSEEYGNIQRNFLADAGGAKQEWDWPDMITLYPHARVGNVFYDEELAGSSGASFRILAMPTDSAEDIELAKQKLRRDRDVVRMSIIHVTAFI